MRFEKRLRALRNRKGISQKALAAAVRTSATQYGRIEKGTQEPRLGLLVALSDFFDVTIDSLVGRDPNERSIPPSLRELYSAAEAAGYTPVKLEEFFRWLVSQKEQAAIKEQNEAFVEKVGSFHPDLPPERIIERLKRYPQDILKHIVEMPDELMGEFQRDLQKYFVFFGLERKPRITKGAEENDPTTPKRKGKPRG